MTRIAFAAIAALSAFSGAPTYGQQWIHCSAQGETCDVDGVGIIRYGVDERWYFQVATDRVPCNDGHFGDPAVGVGKTCQRWETPDETLLYRDAASLRTQLGQSQQQVQDLQGQEEYIAQLEAELAAARQELRQARRGVRRERRENFGPTFEFRR